MTRFMLTACRATTTIDFIEVRCAVSWARGKIGAQRLLRAMTSAAVSGLNGDAAKACVNSALSPSNASRTTCELRTLGAMSDTISLYYLRC